MTNFNYKHHTQKRNNRYVNLDLPYCSWLEYKRIHNIVRYYPTFEQYCNYRTLCIANNVNPQGIGEDEVTAYNSLIAYLTERLK